MKREDKEELIALRIIQGLRSPVAETEQQAMENLMIMIQSLTDFQIKKMLDLSL